MCNKPILIRPNVDPYVLAPIAWIAWLFSRALLNVSRAALNFAKAYRMVVGKQTSKRRRRRKQ